MMTDTRGFVSSRLGAVGCTAAVLLVLGLVNWAGLPQALAATFKPTQIRLSPPRHVPISQKPALAGTKTGGLGPSASLAPPKTHLQIYGDGGTKLDGAQAKLPAPHFRIIDAVTAAPRATPAVTPGLAALHHFYAPAADLARERLPVAVFRAERAQQQFTEVAGVTELVDMRQAARLPDVAIDAAGQLAARLILAALENLPLLDLYISKEDAQARLVGALENADKLGSSPIGSRVWADLLAKDFPSWAYQPKGTVLTTSEPGVVSYRVDSAYLPSTRTPVNIAAFADGMMPRRLQLLTK